MDETVEKIYDELLRIENLLESIFEKINTVDLMASDVSSIKRKVDDLEHSIRFK